MKTILTRINLDIKEEDFESALRFYVAVSLLKSLSKKNNKVVVLSHAGRPYGFEKTLSLQKFVEPLSNSVGKEIIFIESLSADIIRDKINSAKKGTIFLLENLRFNKGEQENSEKFSKALASLGDIYVNNDFATSHHESASLVGITKFIKSKPGELLKKEIKELSKAKKNQKHPFVLIIGGAKAKDKISTIKFLIKDVDKVLLGGVVANTFCKASGIDVEDSLYESDVLNDIKGLAENNKIIMPVDHRSENNKFLDIGSETEIIYKNIIKDAKTIVWAGPMGMFEKPEFAKGSGSIAKAVLANKKANVTIGGAQTIASLPINPTTQKKGNLFLSTGGGAMLYFLAGKELPGLKALNL